MSFSNPSSIGETIETGEVTDGAITNPKLGDNAVTKDKTSGIVEDAPSQVLKLSTDTADYDQPTTAAASSETVDSSNLEIESDSHNHVNSGASIIDDTPFKEDISAYTIPTDDFEIRFPLNITTFSNRTDTNTQFSFVGLVAGDNISSASADRLGLYMRTHNGVGHKFYAAASDGGTVGSLLGTAVSGYDLQVGQIYVKFVLSATNTFTVYLYSDSGYSTLLGSSALDITAQTISGLDHFLHNRRRTVTTNNGNLSFTTDEVTAVSGISITRTALMAVDDNANTFHKSDAGIGEKIYVDMNTAIDMWGVYLRPVTGMTETEFKIRTSETTTFTDAGLNRTILTSKLTLDADNFVRMTRPPTKHRYLEIIGSSGSSLVIAFAKIHPRTETESVGNIASYNYPISPTDTSLNLDGSPA